MLILNRNPRNPTEKRHLNYGTSWKTWYVVYSQMVGSHYYAK